MYVKLLCTSTRIGVTKILLENDANLNVRDDFGTTLLYDLVNHKYKNPSDKIDIIRLLLEAGADLNIRNSHDKKTPIYPGIQNFKMSKFLVKHGAKLNIQDRFGKTPLHLVKDFKTAEFLLENGADLKLHRPFKGTPLHTLNKSILIFR